MSRTLLAGSLALDRIMTFSGNFSDHILPEKVHALSVSFLIDRVTEEFGGTGSNIAYSLALLGAEAEIVATAGKDFASHAERLRSLGIDTGSIAIEKELPTASGYIMTDLSGNQITAFAPGAMNVPYASDIDWSTVALVHVAPTNEGDMRRMPLEARAAGVPFFFDPGQRIPSIAKETIMDGIEGSAALFVNDYELALIIEKTGWSEQELIGKTGVLVVTLGERGSRLMTKDGSTGIEAVAAVPTDPTGAGDAYRAGFIRGYRAGLPDETSAKMASTIAAYAVESHGGQNHAPSLEDLKARYEAAYGETWPL